MRYLYALASLGLFCAVLTPWLGGRVYVLDMLSHFQWQYAMLALCGLVLSCWQQHYRCALLLLGVLSISSMHVGPYLFPPQQDGNGKGTRLTMLQHNVHYLKVDIDDTLSWIEAHAEKIDVVFLQETPTALKQAAIKRLSRHYPYRLIKPNARWHGKILLSKYPLTAQKTLRFPQMHRRIQAIQTYLHVRGKKIALYGLHTSSPITPGYFYKRNIQLQHMAKLLRADRTPYKVLLGDFNATPYSVHYARALEESGLHDAQFGLHLAGSWPSIAPALFRIPIDHLWHSSNMRIISRKVLPAHASDHLPILTELVLH